MRVLAIDPGYDRMGVAVIDSKKPHDRRESLVYSECFTTSAKTPFYERIASIGKEVERLIVEFAPDCMALETLFFQNNQKTAMHVAEARGVIAYQGAVRGLPVHEYSPTEMKIAITGQGRGDKTQIIHMIPRLVTITKEIEHDDEYDAIGIGLTCIASLRTIA